MKVLRRTALAAAAALLLAGCHDNLSAATALVMGKLFFRCDEGGMLNDCDRFPAAPEIDEVVAVIRRRTRTPGISSDIRFESVYRFASSINIRVIAMPLDGPRYRGVSSVSLSRTRPPGRTKSSLFLGTSSSSVNLLSSFSSCLTLRWSSTT